MSKTVLVTGGAGFIGSHTVDALLKKGYAVKVVDILVPQVHGIHQALPRFLPQEVTFLKADICDPDQWGHILDDVDIVIHLAAEVGVGQSMYEIVRYVRSNALGTASLLQALLAHREGIEKLVVASSMSVYGEGAYDCVNCGIVFPRLRPLEHLQSQKWEMRCEKCRRIVQPVPTPEEKPAYPTSVYAVTKRDQEEMCLAFGQAYNIPTVALRFFNVYGSRQALSNPYTGVAAIFAARLLNRKPPPIFEDGYQARDFVHVSDIVNAVLLAINSENAKHDTFNIGTGQPLTVLDVANALAQEIGVSIQPEIRSQFRNGDIRHCYADISKATSVLGYRPQVQFRDGVRELVEWISGEMATDLVDQAYDELSQRGLVH